MNFEQKIKIQIIKLKIVPDLRLGQHILINESVIDELVKSIQNKDTVIEIGAGLGQITEKICGRAKKVIAVEIDKQFSRPLKQIQARNKNLKIFIDSILSINFKDIIGTLKGRVILTGNLPYHIVEPLFQKIINWPITEAVFIVSHRFADESFGKQTWLINAFFDYKILNHLDPDSFYPQPTTKSIIVRLTPKRKSEYIGNKLLFMKRHLIMSGKYGMKIKNALKEGLISFEKSNKKTLTQNQARDLIKKLEIPTEILDLNYSNLSNDQLKTLSILLKKIWKSNKH